jgi:hypothetical protein
MTGFARGREEIDHQIGQRGHAGQGGHQQAAAGASSRTSHRHERPVKTARMTRPAQHKAGNKASQEPRLSATRAGADPGAGHRVSPGSWPDFARIAEYSRFTLGLPRHGTCEQMPQFCAAP